MPITFLVTAIQKQLGYVVWLYHRFMLSLRDVSELLLARGIILSYETIREWEIKFGNVFANKIKRAEHRQHKDINNRAENSHQATRQQEKQMRRFKSPNKYNDFYTRMDKSEIYSTIIVIKNQIMISVSIFLKRLLD